MVENESILVTKPFLPPFEEYVEEISEIWENYWLSNNGPKHQTFEKSIKNYLGVNNVNLFVNGTLALYLAIKALDLKGEVITTPFTFAASSHAIILNGLKPVFCDIEESTFNIDCNKIEELITENTTAIIPVHVFGNPCNVTEIERVAKKYDLKVIYDAAHAFGIEVNNVPIGNFGDISMFSLHATKFFHSIEGGILTCKSSKLYRKLEMLKNFGFNNNGSIELVGTNAKMNEFQAAMGIVNLRHIQDNINIRKKLVLKYRELLKEVRGIRYLEDIEGVKHNYSYFPIIVEDEYKYSRDELHRHLAEKNFFTRKYFYPLCNEFQAYYNGNYSFDFSNLTVAKKISERILCLPLSTHMKIEHVEWICSNL